MGTTSKVPETIILDDSDDEGNANDCQVPGFSGSLLVQPQPPQPTSATNVLQEIMGVVQWANTGVKREGSCAKTLMERKFEEMERKVEEMEERGRERKEQLEHSRLEICVLKQIKLSLELQNRKLQDQLKNEIREKSEFHEKWVQMKKSFSTLYVKLFEDSPPPVNSTQLPIASILVPIREEMGMEEEASEKMESDISTDLQASLVPATNCVSSRYTSCEDTGTSHLLLTDIHRAVVRVEHEESRSLEHNVAKSPSIASSSASRSDDTRSAQRKNRSGGGAEGKAQTHGIDKSKRDHGAFCLCGLKCSSKRTLDSHIIYYTCEKKFVCGICQKRFVGSNYLKGHMLRSHKVNYTGGLNGCRDCGKTFSTLLQLRRHKKLVHYPSVKSNLATIKTTSSKVPTKNRRSIRIRRHQKGEVSKALKMLQGNCSSCQFCRDKKGKEADAGQNQQAVAQYQQFCQKR